MRNPFYAVFLLVFPLTTPVSADFSVFDLEPGFETAASAGSSLVHVVDFENNNLNVGDGALLPPDETFQSGTPLVDGDGFGFANGLSTDLITIDHLGSQPQSSWAVFREADNSDLVFLFGIEIDFVGEPVSAFGMDLDLLINDVPISVQVRDTNGDIVFDENLLLPADFLGVVADGGDSIGSIRIAPPGDPDNIVFFDNMQLWQSNAIPEPNAVLGICFSVALMTLRRRRNAEVELAQ